MGNSYAGYNLIGQETKNIANSRYKNSLYKK